MSAVTEHKSQDAADAAEDKAIAASSDSDSDSDSDSGPPPPPPPRRHRKQHTSEASEAATGKQKQLPAAVKELITKEKEWREKLAQVVDRLLPAFQKYADDPAIRCPQDAPAILFGHFREFKTVHDAIAQRFDKELVDMGSSSDRTGIAPNSPEGQALAFSKALLRHTAFLRHYSDYVRDLAAPNKGLSLVAHCMKSVPGFPNAFSVQLKNAGLMKDGEYLQFVIDGILDCPRQRLTRLQLPLREVLEHLHAFPEPSAANLAARKYVHKAMEAVHKSVLEVDKNQSTVDSAELIKMHNESSTLPSDFPILQRQRQIVDRFTCTIEETEGVGSTPEAALIARKWPMEASLTVCNDCIILSLPVPHGRASLEMVHVFRDLSYFEAVKKKAAQAGSSKVVLEDTVTVYPQRFVVTMRNSDFRALDSFLDEIPAASGSGQKSAITWVANQSGAGTSFSQWMMSVEVAWFSIFCVVALVLRALNPDEVQEKSTLNVVLNRIIKIAGYFLPLLCLQALHAVHSWKSFLHDFINGDFVGWLFVYTFSRFLFEPSVHVVSSTLFGSFVSTQGVSSHMLLTYVSWGYALLVTDKRWFRPPHGAEPLRMIAYAASIGLVVLVFVMYTYMGFITSRFYHNTMDWILAVGTAFAVLRLLAKIVRHAREDPTYAGRALLLTLASETVAGVILVVVNRIDAGNGETGVVQRILSQKLKYVFVTSPTEGFGFYALCVVGVSLLVVLRVWFMKRANAVVVAGLAGQHVVAGVVVAGAIALVGSTDGAVGEEVWRSIVGVITVNMMAAQGRELVAQIKALEVDLAQKVLLWVIVMAYNQVRRVFDPDDTLL